ncbi:MAG: hypothetical protein J0M04_04680 [Verrucomicrobia bacterium]|nr:hypothetical protein [Verrucomicrobiota bacterium]
MKTKAPILVVVGCVIALVATFKVERIEEVCARTGASQRYSRYFSVFSTKPVVKASWVDEMIARGGRRPVDHEWIRTMGDTTTLYSFYRAHDSAPITYWIRFAELNDLRDSFTEQELEMLADDFASGIRERQESALVRFRSRQ